MSEMPGSSPEVRRLVRMLRSQQARIESLERAVTRPQMGFSSIDDGTIVEKDAAGEVVARIGKQPDGTHGVVDYHGPIPPIPTVPEVEGGPASITAVWDGALTEAKPLDLDMVEVYAAPGPFEHIEDATLVGAIPDPDGGRVTVRRPVGDWHIGLVALSRSGKRSAVSELAVATAESVLDSGVLDELEQNLSDLDDALADLDETVLPGLRGRLDAAEATLAPLPDQIAAAEQTAADAEQAALDAAGIAEGKGQVITQISPPSGSRARAENLWVRLPDHKVHIYDGEQWVPATDPDLIAAAGEAATARQEAQAAQSAAQAAQDAADALGTALATVEGDLSDAQGLIDDLGEDVLLAATTAAVENLYVTGTGTVNELVANAVWAAKVAAQKVQAHEVLIGGAQNLWPDPDFAEDVYKSWSRAGRGIERPGTADGGLSVSYIDTEDAFYIPVQPGDTLRITADLTLDGEGRGEIWTREADQDRAYIGGTAANAASAESGQVVHVRTADAPNARHIYIGFGVRDTPPTTTVRWENLRIERMVDNSLIVDGGVLARHITASEEMSAKLAEFLKVRVGQIIGDEAGFDSAVVNQLWADMFAARKVTAEEADLGSIAANEGFVQQLLTHNVDVAGHLRLAGSLYAQQETYGLELTAEGIEMSSQGLVYLGDPFFIPARPGSLSAIRYNIIVSLPVPGGQNVRDSYLVIYDSRTGEVVREIYAESGYTLGMHHYFDVDNEWIWVGRNTPDPNFGPVDLVAYDLMGNQVATRPVPIAISTFAVSDSYIAVDGGLDGGTPVYDHSGNLLRTIPYNGGARYSPTEYTIHGDVLYDRFGETITLTDIPTGNIVQEIQIPHGGQGSASRSGNEWIHHVDQWATGAWYIVVVDLDTNTISEQMQVDLGGNKTMYGAARGWNDYFVATDQDGTFAIEKRDPFRDEQTQASIDTITGSVRFNNALLDGVTKTDVTAMNKLHASSGNSVEVLPRLYGQYGMNWFIDEAERDAMLPHAWEGTEAITRSPVTTVWRMGRNQQWVRVWSEDVGDSGVFLLDEIELTGGADNQASNRLHIPSQGEYKKFVVTVMAGINELGSGQIQPLLVRPNNDSGANYAANAIAWIAGTTHELQNLWGTAFPRTGWVGAYPGSLEITFTVNRPGWWAWTTSGWANMNGSGAMITSGGRWNGTSVVDFLQVRSSNTGQTWRPNSFAQLWGHR